MRIIRAAEGERETETLRLKEHGPTHSGVGPHGRQSTEQNPARSFVCLSFFFPIIHESSISRCSGGSDCLLPIQTRRFCGVSAKSRQMKASAFCSTAPPWRCLRRRAISCTPAGSSCTILYTEITGRISSPSEPCSFNRAPAEPTMVLLKVPAPFQGSFPIRLRSTL